MFLLDTAPSHTVKPIRDQSEALSWKGTFWFEDVKKWLDEWFAAKGEDFYCVVTKIAQKMGRMYNKRWSMCFIILPNLTSLFRNKLYTLYLCVRYIF